MNWHDYFTYDEATGNLIWKERPTEYFNNESMTRKWNKRYVGKVAGGRSGKGYIQVHVCGKLRYAHRIISEMFDGPLLPKQQIDHIDTNKVNNRRWNLRRCSNSQNNMNGGLRANNTSGFKGVCWSKGINRWQAEIMVNNKAKHLGYFHDPKDAHAAYCEAAKELHGEFARTA